jgi:two-component system, chemotaxis family, sensor kinase CheA
MIVAEPDAEAEFLELFRDEANERLDSLVDTLLALESGVADADAINSVFRDAHTIKGGAAMVGLETVRDLAHVMEDVLAQARTAGQFPAQLAEPLLRGADALRRHLAGDNDPTPGLLDDLAASLASAFQGKPEEQATVAEPTTTAAADRRAIRVPPEKIDRLLDLVAETVLHGRRLEHVIGDDRTGDDQSVSDELDLGGRLFGELKDAAIQMRMLPLATITAPLPRAVRDIATAEGKDVHLVISGDDTELDRVILESLAEPLVHMVRNAVGHGIETPSERAAAGKPPRATVELSAQQRGGTVEIVVSDDGRGVSPALIEEASQHGSLAEILARPGFSTATEVTELSGRGVGLDAVKRYVEGFGGTLEVQSEPGNGTAIILVLPLALALLEVLLVERGESVYGLPLASIEEAVTAENVLTLEGRSALELRGSSVQLADLADLIGATAPPLPAGSPAIIVTAGGRRIAATCDRLLGQDEVVVKPLGALLASASGYLGAAILGDGRVALLLDPTSLSRASESKPRLAPTPAPAREKGLAPKILVVEDSFTVRELQRSILQAAGYRVEIASDGREGLDRVSADPEIDLVITDLEMPKMNGLELTRAIRARPESASLPVVIVTSLGSDDDRQAGVEAGADAYMVKASFDQHALLDTVERLVGT